MLFAPAMLAALVVGLWSGQASALADPLDPRRMQGDFDGDSLPDTVLPRPLLDCGKGRVEVRADDGTVTVFSREDPAIWGTASCHDYFGAAMAVGDFNGDGFDDLALSAPGADPGGVDAAGQVHVFYGSLAGLTTAGNMLIDQNTGTVPDVNEPGDHFGDALAAGDFNCDGMDDLVVGAPRELVGPHFEAGFIVVLNGSVGGVSPVDTTSFSEGFGGVDGVFNAYDHWGGALAAGDFNGVGCDDLAVGVPGDDSGGVDAGYVYVMHGFNVVGLDPAGDYTLMQGQGLVGDVAEAGDRFGWALASRDDNADGIDDLFVAVPGEQAGQRPWTHLFTGAGAGLATGNDVLNAHPYDSCAPINDDLGRFPIVVEIADLENHIGEAAGDADFFPNGASGDPWHDYIDAAAFWSGDNAAVADLWTRYAGVIDALADSGVNEAAVQLRLIGYVPYLGSTHEPSWRGLAGLPALDADISTLLSNIDNYDPPPGVDPNDSYHPDWFAGWKLPGEWQADSTHWRYRYSREIRRSLELHSTAQRPLFGYMQNADRSAQEWVYNITAAWSPDHVYQPNQSNTAWSDVASMGPEIQLDPASNVLKTSPADYSSIYDFYDPNASTWSSVELMLDTAGDQLLVFDDPFQGAYTELVLSGCPANIGERFRSWSYHQSRMVREGANNAMDVQLASGQACQQHRGFHMPDLTLDSHVITPAHARHDLWSGMHHAWGLWLHNLAYAIHNNTTTDAWDAYREGMRVLKSGGLRDALVAGRRVAVVPELSQLPLGPNTQTVAAGHEALKCAAPFEPGGYSLALPPYTGVQASLVLNGNTGFLIVSQSIGLDAMGLGPVRYRIELQGDVHQVTRVIGPAGGGCGPEPVNVICDTFDSIDARVYEIRFNSAPSWPPLPEGWIAERFDERY